MIHAWQAVSVIHIIYVYATILLCMIGVIYACDALHFTPVNYPQRTVPLL